MVRRIRADGRTDFENPRYYNIRWLQTWRTPERPPASPAPFSTRPRRASAVAWGVERIVLIGASGQLGTDLGHVLESFLPQARPADAGRPRHHRPGRHRASPRRYRPAWVINTAAFHRVDDIETDAPARGPSPSTRWPWAPGPACARRGARLLHLSTDYVFGGGPPGPYAEDAPPAPVSVYGVRSWPASGSSWPQPRPPGRPLVGALRRRGVGRQGRNFVETMLRLAREGRPIRVVDDQVLTPTYTADLAEAIAGLLAVNPPGRIYHLTNAGACSWFEFASHTSSSASSRPISSRRPAPSSRRRPTAPLTRSSGTPAPPRWACRRSARGPTRWPPTSAPRGISSPDATGSPDVWWPSATMCADARADGRPDAVLRGPGVSHPDPRGGPGAPRPRRRDAGGHLRGRARPSRTSGRSERPASLGAHAARRVLAPPPVPGRPAPRHDAPGRAAIPTDVLHGHLHEGAAIASVVAAWWTARGGGSPGKRGRRDDRARAPARARAAPGVPAPPGAVGPPLARAPPDVLRELRPGARRRLGRPARARRPALRRHRPGLPPARPGPRRPPRAARARRQARRRLPRRPHRVPGCRRSPRRLARGRGRRPGRALAPHGAPERRAVSGPGRRADPAGLGHADRAGSTTGRRRAISPSARSR